jgi:single-stranded DNA-binding protein
VLAPGVPARGEEGVVNVVVLAGRVADRPFRPGNGERVVVKLDVDGENPSKSDRIELHCFGAVAERAMRLWQGDLVGIRGRIELRIWSEDGEEYDELRVVAHRIDVMVKGNTQRPPREGGNWGNREGGRQRGPRDARDQRGGQWLAPHESLGEHRAPVTDGNDFDDEND